MSGFIYLDHSTVTPPFVPALDGLHAFRKDYWGILSAPHQKGLELFPKMQLALKSMYELVGAHEKDGFQLVSGGTEAVHLVFESIYFNLIRESGKNHIVTTAFETDSIAASINHLEKLGCVAKHVSVNASGQVNRELLEEVIRPRTALVSISWANGYTGVIQPIHDLARLCREKGVKLHVDASAVFGKLFFRFQDLDVDFMTLDGKLIHAPQGVGALFVKAAEVSKGNEKEMDVGMLQAFLASIENVSQHFDHLCTETARLRDKLESRIVEGLPEAQVLFQDADRLPNVTAIAFPGISSEALLYALHRKGVYAARGSLEKVLHACGIDPALAHTALSFSLSYQTQETEIDRAAEEIIACVRRLRICAGAL
jgi:cysteine desulfurase